MKFENVSIIITVTRETTDFETLVSLILQGCPHEDIREFIIATSPKLTTPAAQVSIEKMRTSCEEAGLDYMVMEQKLPGMGGAIREALELVRGSHVIIQNADLAMDPSCMPRLIALSKTEPETIFSVSRFMKGGDIGAEYTGLKRLWNYAAQFYLKVLYPSEITDYTHLYRICPAAYYKEVVWQETMHPFALETALKFLRLGHKFKEIPGVQRGGTQSGIRETLLYLPLSLKLRFAPLSGFVKVPSATQPDI